MKKEIDEKFEDTKDRQYNDKIKGPIMIKNVLLIAITGFPLLAYIMLNFRFQDSYEILILIHNVLSLYLDV